MKWDFVLPLVAAHGMLNAPASRSGGARLLGGDCSGGACLWFTNNVKIPGKPTLPQSARTWQRNATTESDIFRLAPWRAPGTAPVLGSGCGVAGGSAKFYNNGGRTPAGIPQGMDGLKLPRLPAESPTWVKGSAVSVGWGISANHGGGYSYRLCKADGNVTEECFQRTPLKFARGEESSIVFRHNGKQIGRTVISEGTFPPGSEWVVNPVPGCFICDARQSCGEPLPPVSGRANTSWSTQVECYADCDGLTASRPGSTCPPGTAQFLEPLIGISGFGGNGVGEGVFDWSVFDTVVVPEDIPAGEYLLSWRWDCEESFQVWQNCADVVVAERSR